MQQSVSTEKCDRSIYRNCTQFDVEVMFEHCFNDVTGRTASLIETVPMLNELRGYCASWRSASAQLLHADLGFEVVYQ